MRSVPDLLLGHFAGIDQLHASPWSSAETAAVHIDSTAELGGAVVLMRVTEVRATGSFHAINIVMTDRDTGEVLLYGFDSLGYRPEPPARGRPEHGELVLERCTERGHSRITFSATPSGFDWAKRFRSSSDEPWESVVTGNLHRVPAPATARADS